VLSVSITSGKLKMKILQNRIVSVISGHLIRRVRT